VPVAQITSCGVAWAGEQRRSRPEATQRLAPVGPAMNPVLLSRPGAAGPRGANEAPKITSKEEFGT
jgi:hypothetical protein